MNLYLISLLLCNTIYCKDINFPSSSRHIIQDNSTSQQDLLNSSSRQSEYPLNSEDIYEDEEDIYESSSIDSNSSEFSSYQSEEREDIVVTVNATADRDVTASPRNATVEKDVVVIEQESDLFPFAKSVFQRSLEWMEDAYTLSILMPIGAGVVFALTVILMLATCRCLRRCRRRKRFRKKALPESIKNLTASDRARLLGDFSDEEF